MRDWAILSCMHVPADYSQEERSINIAAPPDPSGE